jgi:hypothetical protein
MCFTFQGEPSRQRHRKEYVDHNLPTSKVLTCNITNESVRSGFLAIWANNCFIHAPEQHYYLCKLGPLRVRAKLQVYANGIPGFQVGANPSRAVHTSMHGSHRNRAYARRSSRSGIFSHCDHMLLLLKRAVLSNRGRPQYPVQAGLRDSAEIAEFRHENL